MRTYYFQTLRNAFAIISKRNFVAILLQNILCKYFKYVSKFVVGKQQIMF